MIHEKKIRLGLTIFGLLVVAYSVMELIQGRFSTSQSYLLILEGLAGVLLIYIPDLFEKLFKINIPATITYFYWFFLVLSVFLGTCLHFMSIFAHWDKLLHAFSPMILTAVGYGLISMFLKDAPLEKTSPWLFLLMGFAFAGVAGVFWEFWEFFCDSFFDMNLQRYLSHGNPLVGQAALLDTMGDLITNTLGALVMGIYAGIQSKGNPRYFERYKIEKIKKA